MRCQKGQNTQHIRGHSRDRSYTANERNYFARENPCFQRPHFFFVGNLLLMKNSPARCDDWSDTQTYWNVVQCSRQQFIRWSQRHCSHCSHFGSSECHFNFWALHQEILALHDFSVFSVACDNFASDISISILLCDFEKFFFVQYGNWSIKRPMHIKKDCVNFWRDQLEIIIDPQLKQLVCELFVK